MKKTIHIACFQETWIANGKKCIFRHLEFSTYQIYGYQLKDRYLLVNNNGLPFHDHVDLKYNFYVIKNYAIK